MSDQWCNSDHSNCVLVTAEDGMHYHVVDPSPETTALIARLDRELRASELPEPLAKLGQEEDNRSHEHHH